MYMPASYTENSVSHSRIQLDVDEAAVTANMNSNPEVSAKIYNSYKYYWTYISSLDIRSHPLVSISNFGLVQMLEK